MIHTRRLPVALFSMTMLAAASALDSAIAQEVQPPIEVEVREEQSGPSAEEFDRWIDQIVQGINDHDSLKGGRLVDWLGAKLDWIETTCKTSAGQRKKLEIAGLGDIKRFLDEMRAIKRAYRQVRANPAEAARALTRLGDIRKSTGAEVFGDSSLLVKTLQKTLTPEQAGAYARATEESRVFQRKSEAAQAVGICDTAIGMTDLQRCALGELLVREPEGAKRSEGTGLAPPLSMILRTARSSRGKLKAVFDDRQWVVMSALLKQLEEGENELRQNNQIELPMGGVAVEFLDSDLD